MRKYLLPESGNFYKANLHCHSTYSDGRWTPEEIKKAYTRQGYSIVAYTDHNVLIPHHELTDENFLAILGTEIDIDEDVTHWAHTRAAHWCILAIDPDNDIQPCWHREKYQLQNAILHRDEVKFDESEPDYERVYSPECINDMMKTARDKGFFVTYNHPAWSLEGYETYSKFEHMHALEIFNYSSYYEGYNDRADHVYDELLRQGKRIYAIATDDNHNRGANDSFGGFTMIKADKLEYRTVMQAIVDGNFYASEGPIIHDLYYEDGKVYITFDAAREAFITKDIRRCQRVWRDGELITSAVFDVKEDETYFRITVVGADGKRAYTNAYFIDEIMK